MIRLFISSLLCFCFPSYNMAQDMEFLTVEFTPNTISIEVPLVAKENIEIAGYQLGIQINSNSSISLEQIKDFGIFNNERQIYDDSTFAILWYDPLGQVINVDKGDTLAILELNINDLQDRCFQIATSIDNIDNVIFIKEDEVLSDRELQIEDSELCSFDDLIVQLQFSNNNCFGDEEGSANVIISGGIEPYFVSWLDGDGIEFASEINSIDNLNNGNYSVIIMDSFGNQITESFTIDSPPVLEFEFIKTDSICSNTMKGEAEIFSGQDLTYQWSTSSIESHIEELSNGNYSVIISNQNGCDSIVNFTIFEYPLPNLLHSTTETCQGKSNASIVFSDLDLNYTWSNGDSGNILDSISSGIYAVTISDQNECIFEINNIQVKDFPMNQISTSVAQISCFGASDGFIELDPQDFQSIEWSTGSNEFDIDELGPGTYGYYLKDFNGCELTDSISIFEPDQIVYTISLDSATCYLCDDGGIELNIEGGTAPFAIIVSDSLGDNFDLEKLLPQPYLLEIIDDSGCTVDSSFRINLKFLDINIFKPISVITPSSNDKNDALIFDGLENHPDNILKIYNRWGNIVFSSIRYQQPEGEVFNGIYEGGLLPEGKYYYILEVKSFNKPLSNSLTIIR